MPVNGPTNDVAVTVVAFTVLGVVPPIGPGEGIEPEFKAPEMVTVVNAPVAQNKFPPAVVEHPLAGKAPSAVRAAAFTVRLT